MMVKESLVNNNPVYRSSQVGVPRHTTPNGAVKPFFVGYAQIRKPYKKPAKPFQHRLRGRFYAWWSGSGQSGQFYLGKETFVVRKSKWLTLQEEAVLSCEKFR